ncbi:MAG: sugar transferase [archaeon]
MLRQKKRTNKIHKDTFFFHFSTRVGQGERLIGVPKIRTMKGGAAYQEKGAHNETDHMAKHNGKDKRIIPVIGRVLRVTHFDESPQLVLVFLKKLLPVGIRPLLRHHYKALPKDIREIYSEMGPGLGGIQYACRHFPPPQEEEFAEYRRFYKIWKKNPTRAYIEYASRIVFNKLTGKAWSK